MNATAATPAAGTFTETDVTVDADAATLAGTLTTPAGPSRGAVLVLPGSGKIDRHGDQGKLRLSVSRDLAHALADRGFTSYRYDKRGIAQSTGDFLTAGLMDLVADADAALRMLAERASGQPIFLIGHSEGAMLAEKVAADHPELAGVVLLAAPARTGEETMRWQAAQIAEALPPFARFVTRLFRIDLLAQQAKTIEKIRATTTDVARLQGQRINAKWQRELLDFDPKPYLARITSPVLAITGGKDIQVDADDLADIAATVAGPVEVRRPADLTHLLRDEPGAPSLANYKKLLKQPTKAELVREIVDWIERAV